ncbi:hypothetical protein Pla163_31150 [Planctomycetes bacterium Pla163]|uniref:Uncharacterized protein n=1 Tax=Rohdeia mirabilis TaxID=2528008 RepID=A0A518D3B7_9BACT|nr:hypothetical protein Pla163_31150 [Planctomycetes bacterium Pla163]
MPEPASERPCRIWCGLAAIGIGLVAAFALVCSAHLGSWNVRVAEHWEGSGTGRLFPIGVGPLALTSRASTTRLDVLNERGVVMGSCPAPSGRETTRLEAVLVADTETTDMLGRTEVPKERMLVTFEVRNGAPTADLESYWIEIDVARPVFRGRLEELALEAAADEIAQRLHATHAGRVAR